MKIRAITCAALFAFAAAGAAHAGVTIGSESPTDVIPVGQTLVADFSAGSALSGGFSYSGSTFTSGTVSNTAAAPYNDATEYAYVLGGSSATLTSPYGLKSLSLYVGSVDAYNTIEFDNASGIVGTITGDQILSNASGFQGAGGSTRVDFDFSAPVTSVKFSSSQNSFEFDDIAVSGAPEPGLWALMLGGIGILGGMLRIASARRRGEFNGMKAA